MQPEMSKQQEKQLKILNGKLCNKSKSYGITFDKQKILIYK